MTKEKRPIQVRVKVGVTVALTVLVGLLVFTNLNDDDCDDDDCQQPGVEQVDD